MNSSNLKDTISNICGGIIAIGGSLLAMSVSGTLPLPTSMVGILSAAVAIATAVIGYFTGKTPSGAVKTDNQVANQNVK